MAGDETDTTAKVDPLHEQISTFGRCLGQPDLKYPVLVFENGQRVIRDEQALQETFKGVPHGLLRAIDVYRSQPQTDLGMKTLLRDWVISDHGWLLLKGLMDSQKPDTGMAVESPTPIVGLSRAGDVLGVNRKSLSRFIKRLPSKLLPLRIGDRYWWESGAVCLAWWKDVNEVEKSSPAPRKRRPTKARLAQSTLGHRSLSEALDDS